MQNTNEQTKDSAMFLLYRLLVSGRDCYTLFQKEEELPWIPEEGKLFLFSEKGAAKRFAEEKNKKIKELSPLFWMQILRFGLTHGAESISFTERGETKACNLLDFYRFFLSETAGEEWIDERFLELYRFFRKDLKKAEGDRLGSYFKEHREKSLRLRRKEGGPLCYTPKEIAFMLTFLRVGAAEGEDFPPEDLRLSFPEGLEEPEAAEKALRPKRQPKGRKVLKEQKESLDAKRNSKQPDPEDSLLKDTGKAPYRLRKEACREELQRLAAGLKSSVADRKTRWKIFWGIFFAGFLFILFATGFKEVSFLSDRAEFEKALSEGSCKEAYEIYSGEEEQERKELESILKRTVKETVSEVFSGTCSLEEGTRRINALKNYSGIKRDCIWAEGKLDVLEASMDAYEAGRRAGKTMSRLLFWKQVLAGDKTRYPIVLKEIRKEKEDYLKMLTGEAERCYARWEEGFSEVVDTMEYWYPEAEETNRWTEKRKLLLEHRPKKPAIHIQKITLKREKREQGTLRILWVPEERDLQRVTFTFLLTRKEGKEGVWEDSFRFLECPCDGSFQRGELYESNWIDILLPKEAAYAELTAVKVQSFEGYESLTIGKKELQKLY